MTIIRYASNRQSSNNHSKYDRKEGMKETTTEEINITRKIEETENINS
jgi:hypothetical protein